MLALLTGSGQIMKKLGESDLRLAHKIQNYLLILLILPPVFSVIGGTSFGWYLGASEPIVLTMAQSVTISILYFVALCFGFFSTVFIAHWMGQTYGVDAPIQVYLAFFTVVCAPLLIASVAHLFPHVFFNVVVMIPALIWSLLRLYTGLPVALNIPTERGMLMSSALVGWLLVAAVSLLGLSAALWTIGLGPAIRV